MSKLFVDQVDPKSATTLTLGTSGDTITIPSGAELKSNKISPASGTAFTLGDSGDTFTVPAGATITNSGTATGFGGGKINQVVTASKIDTSTFSSSSTNTYVDLSGLSVSITPSAADSKILILMNAYFTYSTGMAHVRLMRDTTEIGSATASSSQIGNIMGFRINDSDPYGLSVWPGANHFIDSPSTTSATTYKLQGTLGSSYSGTFYINRSPNDTDANYGWRVPSNITVMEILA